MSSLAVLFASRLITASSSGAVREAIEKDFSFYENMKAFKDSDKEGIRTKIEQVFGNSVKYNCVVGSATVQKWLQQASIWSAVMDGDFDLLYVDSDSHCSWCHWYCAEPCDHVDLENLLLVQSAIMCSVFKFS